ncbi:MAG: phosphate ABC transporter substrate-binding protein PstS [Gaiellaceae bacterium]
MNRKRTSAAGLARVAVVALALTVWTSLAGASPARQTASVSGAGSSALAPLMALWQTNYHGSQISYTSNGSGAGINAITARNVDFGASDAPLTPDQAKACNGCLMIPWAFFATSLPYNVSGVGYGLNLTGPIVANIFLGHITKWNDKRIKAINPGVNLPNENITPIYRSDGSGTSFNFTDYLSRVSTEWKNRVGKGTQPSFPAGVGARGSSGVAAKLNSTPGGITYVDVAYSYKNHFRIAKLKNRAGKFVLPRISSIQAAAASIKKVTRKDNAISIVDPSPSKKGAYPICTFTWAIVPAKSPKAADLKSFLDWAVTKGQSYGQALVFAPIPKPVVQAARRTIQKIHS